MIMSKQTLIKCCYKCACLLFVTYSLAHSSFVYGSFTTILRSRATVIHSLILRPNANYNNKLCLLAYKVCHRRPMKSLTPLEIGTNICVTEVYSAILAMV